MAEVVLPRRPDRRPRVGDRGLSAGWKLPLPLLRLGEDGLCWVKQPYLFRGDKPVLANLRIGEGGSGDSGVGSGFHKYWKLLIPRSCGEDGLSRFNGDKLLPDSLRIGDGQSVETTRPRIRLGERFFLTAVVSTPGKYSLAETFASPP